MPDPTTTGGPPPAYKDNEFYMSLLTFKVENALFRVPAEPFQTRSEVFRDMFSLSNGEGEGKSDDMPIVLEGVELRDFRAFLRYLYPKKAGTGSQFSQDEWVGIHTLSDMWGFEEAKNASKTFLANSKDSILKLELATRFHYEDWLHRAYRELAERPTSLSKFEAERIGFEATSRIAHLREFGLKARLENQVACVCMGVLTNFTCPRCRGRVTGQGQYCCRCEITFYATQREVDEVISDLVKEEMKANLRSQL